ncbi:hypothetical protein [Dysgonomonas macrotermitis]|uniref:Uncharacterized protein n=1 Tax=Dysgonomonas macrotermitis TaxID=1346286 RepID=A0A1M5K234_9BACT|nr:hypothetical protein [Dysgonomonas macrotermitis]SHG46912.1 hypothetical protein SAMN05444362_1341 [Dysgonomonas macrotermitis]
MKKAILFTLISIAYTTNSYSQIGIMTENPVTNSLVHIDAKSNNTQTGSNLNLDDVVIGQNGNVGLGTTAPQKKLHIVTGGTATTPNPQVRIEDGYQATNKVLMSDANGLARWSDYIPGYQAGVVGAGITHATTLTGTSQWSKTNMTITLDPGQWLIFYMISMTTNTVTVSDSNYRCWVQVSMGDNSTTATTDAISKNRFSNNAFVGKRTIINGWIAIDNKTTAAKTYVLYVGAVQNSMSGLNLLNVGEVNDGYSNIYAFRINMQ